MKKIEDYLLHYLGSDIIYNGRKCKLLGVHLGYVVIEHPVGFVKIERKDYADIKLCLRPLDSMTEEEANELVYICNSSEIFQKGSIVYSFDGDRFKWGLNKRFDLFDLIKEGLAIDATLTPANNI